MKTPPEVGTAEEREMFHWKGARGPEFQLRTRVPPDSQDSRWLVALAKKQLALVTDDGSHGISFGWRFHLKLKGPAASLRHRPVPFQQRTNTSW